MTDAVLQTPRATTLVASEYLQSHLIIIKNYKSAGLPHSLCMCVCVCVCVFVYIYIYTHTHTHSFKLDTSLTFGESPTVTLRN